MEQNCHPKIETGYGIAKGASSFETGMEAAKMALDNIHEYSISAVMVYSSVEYDLSEVLQGIYNVVGEKPVFGTTTAGEICNGAYKGTVLVVILASPYLKVHCGVGTDVSKNWRNSLNEAINSPSVKPFFEDINEFSRKIKMEGKNIFIMLFSPGNTRYNNTRSYEILEALKIKSLGIYPIIGGSSADDWQMEKNYVFHGKEVYSDSILLAVFETELQFGISMTNGFHPTKLKTKVTSVDGYEVLTLDGLPAEDALSKLLNTSKETLLGKHYAQTTGIPLGVSNSMGQYGIITASYSTAQGGIWLSAQVPPGTVFTVMQPDSTNIIDAGTEALSKAFIRGGITDAAISFAYYCALRPRIIGERYEEEIANMANMLSDKPLVGFFSFGEQGVADDGVCRHNNSSIACIVLGNELSQMAQVAFEKNRLLKEIMEYDQLKSEFITNISHELRTPINVILSTLQLMELKGTTMNQLLNDEKSEHYIKMMKQNCYRLVRLTNNLIDITKIEAGFSELDLHNYNAVQVIEDITLSVAEYAMSKGLELIFDTNTEEKVMAFDADKLERIMLNLLSNAVKFSKTEGKISVYFQDNNDTISITVKDTGIGIPQDKQEIIFERFRQVDRSLSRKNEGSGIGLSLVKSLVELHEGTISVQSAYGKGTEFIIELPVKLIDEGMNIKPKFNNSHDPVQKTKMEFSDIYTL
ncbi:MAG: ATP-binding protein [Bacillota bacterium]|nr:ATP-binding protein [Bacillota bacterium]